MVFRVSRKIRINIGVKTPLQNVSLSRARKSVRVNKGDYTIKYYVVTLQCVSTAADTMDSAKKS